MISDIGEKIQIQKADDYTREALEAALLSDPEEKTHPTMVHAIVHSSLPPQAKTFDRVSQEVGTVTGAGFETTANVLRVMFFHVYTNKEIFHRLREEIFPVMNNSETEEATLSALEQLPYLTAVIMEGLRLSPGTSSRTQRVPDKDLVYNDSSYGRNWRIPAGTPIGMTTLLMHTDDKLYPEPMRFNPDRWVDPRDRRALEKTFAPFSKGTRICLGMQ